MDTIDSLEKEKEIIQRKINELLLKEYEKKLEKMADKYYIHIYDNYTMYIKTYKVIDSKLKGVCIIIHNKYRFEFEELDDVYNDRFYIFKCVEITKEEFYKSIKEINSTFIKKMEILLGEE